MILLNPGPANTTEGVKQALLCPDICPREREFGEVMARVARRLARLVGDEQELAAVLVCGSGTAAVEAAIATAVPADGRLLVIDNGSYGERMATIACRWGIVHRVARFGFGGDVDLGEVRRLLDRQPATQVAMVHHETSTGMLNPVPAVAAICREHGAELLVDAMSSYAGIPFTFEELGADFLISSANKCLQGMPGLAFAIGRRERLASSPPGRSLYLDLGDQHRFFEATGQLRFTPPVQVVYALDRALVELEEEGGVAARHRRYRSCWRVLDGGMRELAFQPWLDEERLSGLLTCYHEPTHDGYRFERLHDALYRRGYTIYPGKNPGKDLAPATFRLANIGAVTPADMLGFLAALKDTLDELGLDPLYPEGRSPEGRAPE